MICYTCLKAFSCHDCKQIISLRRLARGCHTNLPRFQGARPDHVRVESSSCCFPRELVSFDPVLTLLTMTRSPPIGKRIWVGRYNKIISTPKRSTRETNIFLLNNSWLILRIKGVRHNIFRPIESPPSYSTPVSFKITVYWGRKTPKRL